MKKLFFLLPLLLFSCNKKETVAQSKNEHSDSVAVTVPDNNPDTLEESLVPLEKTETKPSDAFRSVEGRSIIKTVNGDMIPMVVQDEFTKDNQEYILKIKNFNHKKITGNIVPDNDMMNIRFNQIKLADGEFDGPFGRDISYDIKKPGEIWLIISKSNMASGESTGKFSVQVK